MSATDDFDFPLLPSERARADELHRTRQQLETLRRRYYTSITAGRCAWSDCKRVQAEANEMRRQRDLWRLVATVAIGGVVLIAGICAAGAL